MRLDDYLNKDDLRVFSYYGEGLTCQAGLPKKLPKGTAKVIYFLKNKSAGKIGDPAAELMMNEMGPEPLEHLEKVLAEIYLPLLSNPSNQDGWGEIASKEIVDRLHGFLSSVSITVGLTRGETCLPLPPLDASTAGALSTKDRVHLLEDAVITWTKQLKHVLKADPEAALKEGLNPTPDVEVAFWKVKAANLNAIFDQLQSERIRRVLQFLDTSKSTYCAPFANLCKEVFAAREEANDNARFLMTLEPWFQRLQDADSFEGLASIFRPIMHVLLLIWKHSRFYNTPARLVVVIREICNAVVAKAGQFLTGKQVFELIADEQASAAMGRLRTLLRVCGDFKRIYFRYKQMAAADCPQNPWRIQNNALFVRLDSFLERVHDVLETASVMAQFLKLEKITIGGFKGKQLSATLDGIYADFKATVATLEGVPYDLLDVEAKAFAGDLATFRGKIKEFDRRLAAVLSQGFEDATTITARFKLLDSFDSLLERPTIADELDRKYLSLVQDFGRDLKRVQEVFLEHRERPPLSWNLPPQSGALSWCRGLRERITEPMARVRGLSKSLQEREESKEVAKLYATIVAQFDEFETSRVEEWGADVEKSSQEKLNLPLLTQTTDEEGEVVLELLSVNFDPALIRLLREVKYFLLLGLEVPMSALEVYKKAETFRRQTGNLDLIVQMYNQMMKEMLPVEAPLLKAQLAKIDQTLQRGVAEINWKSQLIDGFLGEAQASVKTAFDMLFQLKQNLRDIVSDMEVWSKDALLTRKSKPMTPDEFEGLYKSIRMLRYTAIAEGGKAIDKKLKESAAIMKVPKTGSSQWSAYVDFANGIVVQGLSRLVTVSLRKLCDLLNAEKIKKAQDLPMIVIDLMLPAGKPMRFAPDVHEAETQSSGKPGNLYDIVNTWVDSFYHSAALFKRLDAGEGTYVQEMADDLEVQMLLATLNDVLARSEQACSEFRAKYEAFAYLYTTPMDEAFKQFTTDAYMDLPRSEEQLAYEANLNPDDVPKQPRVPDLAKFDAVITKYTEVVDAVEAMKTPTDIGWLRVNSQPIKYSLATLAQQWAQLFTTHLTEYVVSTVSELAAFVANTITGLEEEVTGQDPLALRRCMGYIRSVKQTRYVRKAIIAPLRKAISLLKKHGANVNDLNLASGGSLIDYLDQADLKVEQAINKTFGKKEAIFPFQTAEMEKIKAQAVSFDESVRAFWNSFRKNAPFNFQGPVIEAYKALDGFFLDLVKIEAGAAELNFVEELYELPVSKFNEPGQCRAQLKLLKSLWDFKAFVTFTFDNWRMALWSEINTETLEDANKKMGAELKRLGDANSIAKAWTVFKDVEVMLRDMAVTLPLVNELHSPSMRPRHWKALALECGVKSLDPTDAKFALDDMLSLKLHTHVEQASEIVDTANKEQKIEKKMDEIEAAWRIYTLDYKQHKDSDVRVPAASDEVLESLDAHQMELQGIVGMGKVMEFFRARVDVAQKNLGTVEEVLKEWLNVSKNWASLEAIFLASADIRAQLPDDTKRFEGIDQAFKELMKSASETTNCVEACTKEGRGEQLKDMTKNLELCQKSLNEYLDMKKKIYPRFYFVSNVALLDILSNGNNPPLIMKYLGDCYDSINGLKFIEPADPNAIKTQADKMISKDGEVVNCYKTFVMLGAVERWLNELTTMQQDSLRYIAEAAIEAGSGWDTGERPRHFWTEDCKCRSDRAPPRRRAANRARPNAPTTPALRPAPGNHHPFPRAQTRRRLCSSARRSSGRRRRRRRSTSLRAARRTPSRRACRSTTTGSTRSSRACSRTSAASCAPRLSRSSRSTCTRATRCSALSTPRPRAPRASCGASSCASIGRPTTATSTSASRTSTPSTATSMSATAAAS